MSRPHRAMVMIRGKVDSDAAKQAAEGIAKGIDGVKSVKNELQVVAPAKREAIDDKDDGDYDTGSMRRSRKTPL